MVAAETINTAVPRTAARAPALLTGDAKIPVFRKMLTISAAATPQAAAFTANSTALSKPVFSLPI